MVVPTPNAAASHVDTGIRVITVPSVYVLGRQTVDDAELNRFLTDHGVSWQTDSEVAGAHGNRERFYLLRLKK